VNPNLGPILVRTNGGDSIYHAGQLTLDRKFSHGLLLRGAYTYSKFIDDTSEVFVTSGLSSFAQNVLNQGADRGLSAYDRRHRMVLTYVWDVPFVRGSSNRFSSTLHAITRDWQTSGIFTWSSGAPETFNDGFDVNGDGHGGNDRPNLGNPAAPLTAIGIDGTQLGLTNTPGTFFGPNIQACLNGAPTCVAGPASNFHFLILPVGSGMSAETPLSRLASRPTTSPFSVRSGYRARHAEAATPTTRRILECLQSPESWNSQPESYRRQLLKRSGHD